ALDEFNTDFKKSSADLIRSLVLLILSIGALILGAELLVNGAVVIATSWGIEERVIALSIIAFGTSAPELATSLMAVFKKEASISIGNLIGSNIFNILGILGVTAMVEPTAINASVLEFDYYWMVGIPLLLFPFIITRMILSRVEGALLFACYLMYMWLIF
ncbi:MAG: sodium:calcium antiporter, partial [Salibacteraceae bacterium]